MVKPLWYELVYNKDLHMTRKILATGTRQYITFT